MLGTEPVSFKQEIILVVQSVEYGVFRWGWWNKKRNQHCSEIDTVTVGAWLLPSGNTSPSWSLSFIHSYSWTWKNQEALQKLPRVPFSLTSPWKLGSLTPTSTLTTFFAFCFVAFIIPVARAHWPLPVRGSHCCAIWQKHSCLRNPDSHQQIKSRGARKPKFYSM